MAQTEEFKLDTKVPTNVENEPRPVFPVPSARQLAWNQTEFYAFFHYGMDTYTDREWGDGREKESLFAPTQAPNPKQWLEAIKAGGMRGGIAVVKHHDGFCLWPTETTDHCVKNAGNEFGKNTNIPRDFAAAAKELGLKYGSTFLRGTVIANIGVKKLMANTPTTMQRKYSLHSVPK